MKENKKGITLVALVITIIILLILAGITISQLTGSGLFENAKLAQEKSKNAQEKEDGILLDYENKIGEYIDSSRDDVSNKKFELGDTYTNCIYGTVTNTTELSIDLEAGEYICEATFCLAYTDSNANINEESNWNPISISGAENFKEINNTCYKSSGSTVLFNSNYACMYKLSKVFIVSSDDDFTLTATNSSGWANTTCPIIMDIKCTEIL